MNFNVDNVKEKICNIYEMERDMQDFKDTLVNFNLQNNY